MNLYPLMGIFLIYFACLVTRYPDMEVNLGPPASVLARCRIMFANMNGLHCNLDELAVAASLFDIDFCCETKATRRHHAAELRLPDYCVPVLLPRGFLMGWEW